MRAVSKTQQDPRRRTYNLFRKLHALPRLILSQASAEAVHQLRTTVHRFETLAATDLPHDADGTGRLLKQLGRLRRRAGKLRDVQVQMAALRTVRAGNKRDKAELKQALQRLEENRARKLVRTVQDDLANGLDKRLKHAAVAFSESAGAKPAGRRGALVSALDKFAALAEHQPPLTEENLHDFRVDCKCIRYEAEMEGASLAAQQALKQFKRIQDAIGEWHDWVNLAQSAEEAVGNQHSPLLSAIRAGRRAKYNEAVRITAEARERLLELRGTLKPALAKPASEPNSAAMQQAAS